MSATRPLFNDFSSGELSPKLDGRVDLPIFYKGAKEITNFQPRVLGGVSKRPGTKYVTNTASNNKARLIPWVINSSYTFLIELTAFSIRFIDVATNAVVAGTNATITTTYAEADLYEIKYAQTSKEIILVHPDYAPVWIRYISGTASAVVIDYSTSYQSFAGNRITWTCPTTTPYEMYDFWDDVAQWLTPRKSYTATGTINGRTVSSLSRDELSVTIAFSSNQTYASIGTTLGEATLTGFSDLTVNVLKGFQVSGTGIPTGAYVVSNTATEVTISAVATATGTITLTVGDLEFFRSSTYYVQSTADLKIDFRPFIGAGNYPGAAAFFNGRLWLGGSTNDPNTIWGSKPWDYCNFVMFEEIEYTEEVETASGRVGSDFVATSVSGETGLTSLSPAVEVDALIGKYATGVNIAYGTLVEDNEITGVTLNKVALGSGVFSVAFSTWKDALVPEYTDTTSITQQIGAGSAIRLVLNTEEDERILWIAGLKDLYVGTTSSEWVIPGGTTAIQASAFLLSRYGSANIQARAVGDGILYVNPSSRQIRQISQGLTQPITLQAEHMINEGVLQTDFAQTPDVCFYCVLENGELVRCLIEPSVGVNAWSRIRANNCTAGLPTSTAYIESIAVVPGTDYDLVYVSVKRSINSSTVRFIEVFQENDDLTVAKRIYLDAYTTKTAAAFTTVTGLTWLASEWVTAWTTPAAGGAQVITRAQVSAGGVLTVPSSTYALVGIAYEARLRTHRIESTSTEGMKKAVGSVFFRLYYSYGFYLRYSTNESKPYNTVSVTSPPFTGTVEVTTDIPTLIDSELVIDSDDPVPVGIQTIVPYTEITA